MCRIWFCPGSNACNFEKKIIEMRHQHRQLSLSLINDIARPCPHIVSCPLLFRLIFFLQCLAFFLLPIGAPPSQYLPRVPNAPVARLALTAQCHLRRPLPCPSLTRRAPTLMPLPSLTGISCRLTPMAPALPSVLHPLFGSQRRSRSLPTLTLTLARF